MKLNKGLFNEFIKFNCTELFDSRSSCIETNFYDIEKIITVIHRIILFYNSENRFKGFILRFWFWRLYLVSKTIHDELSFDNWIDEYSHKSVTIKFYEKRELQLKRLDELYYKVYSNIFEFIK